MACVARSREGVWDAMQQTGTGRAPAGKVPAVWELETEPTLDARARVAQIENGLLLAQLAQSRADAQAAELGRRDPTTSGPLRRYRAREVATCPGGHLMAPVLGSPLRDPTVLYYCGFCRGVQVVVAPEWEGRKEYPFWPLGDLSGALAGLVQTALEQWRRGSGAAEKLERAARSGAEL